MALKKRIEVFVFSLEDDSDIEKYRKCMDLITNNNYRIVENIVFAEKHGQSTTSKKLLTYETYTEVEEE